MITTSEYVVTITIWVLTLPGAFFGGRAAWRRRRKKRAVGNQKGRAIFSISSPSPFSLPNQVAS
jgi:hypothetical protein